MSPLAKLAVDRPVDDPRRIDTVAAQSSDEGHGFPVAVRDRCSEPPAARRPAPQWRHIRLDGFIEKDQPTGFGAQGIASLASLAKSSFK